MNVKFSTEIRQKRAYTSVMKTSYGIQQLQTRRPCELLRLFIPSVVCVTIGP
jgi:hypothetical protein